MNLHGNNFEIVFDQYIYQGDTLIDKTLDISILGKSKIEIVSIIKSDYEKVLEKIVIDSGQISNYNKFFILLRKNGAPWFLVEYRPTFQYKWYSGKYQILSFLQRLGVKLAKI